MFKEAEKEARKNRAWLAGALAYSGRRYWWGLFHQPQRLQAGDLRALADASPVVLSALESDWTPADYSRAFEEIRRALERGDTYQANLTFFLRGKAAGGGPWSPCKALRLWLDLQAHGQGREGGFLHFEGNCLLSLSPELFFEMHDSTVTCRPMKGTEPRFTEPSLDEQARHRLLTSPKTRAENLMITDMIRNDLGIFAAPGSVVVPQLFQAEPYPTVWQMTSTVQARLPEAHPEPLGQTLEALFPCASITGAPKKRTMELLKTVENNDRGWYTGTLGWVKAPQAPAAGLGTPRETRARFGVNIRTLEIEKDGRFRLGVGGGVLWDSDPESEYGEAFLKSRFLQSQKRTFDLTEALLWDPRKGFFLLERHKNRMHRAFDHFGGVWNSAAFDAAAEEAVLTCVRGLKDPIPLKVRILADPDFELRALAEPLAGPLRPLTAALAERPLTAESLLFRRFKTSERSCYTSRNDVDQTIFYNTEGRLTESTTMNLVLDLDGKRLTPASSAGLLEGTFREELLEKGQIAEADLTVIQLFQAKKVWLINSVRGWQEVRLR